VVSNHVTPPPLPPHTHTHDPHKDTTVLVKMSRVLLFGRTGKWVM
jgi:hypothetical protein